MAKKKSSPKKKPAPKKSCGKKNCEVKKPEQVIGGEFKVKPLTKADYFFGMIKKAFGYE
jgi:hypothetical protein